MLRDRVHVWRWMTVCHTEKTPWLLMNSTAMSSVESAEKLQSELREVRVQHYTLKEQHDDLKEKMKFFTKVTGGRIFYVYDNVMLIIMSKM